VAEKEELITARRRLIRKNEPMNTIGKNNIQERLLKDL
jgi:hypothetical protein